MSDDLKHLAPVRIERQQDVLLLTINAPANRNSLSAPGVLEGLLGRPEMATDPRFRENKARVENRAALRAELGRAMSDLPSDTLCNLLAQAGVVAGAVRTMAEVKPGQAGVSVDLFVEVSAAGRESIRIPGIPIMIDQAIRVGGRLPALGEHTDEVLTELDNEEQVS